LVVIHISTLLKHYKRPDVQAALCEAAADREVGMYYGKGESYGKRPDVLSMPGDVLDFVKQGVTSFHISEERWKDPLAVVTGMQRRELDALRSGWDLVIDIDCPWLDYSKVAAHVLCEKLTSLGISCHRVKFSGNHGFHIGVPFEAFPQQAMFEGKQREVRELFPEGPRRIAAYLQDEIRVALGNLLVKRFTLDTIKATTGKTHGELVKNNPTTGRPYLDPFSLLSIDTILIAPRHLVRAPYSLHDKSGLCSIPVDQSQLLTFDKKTAAPELVKVDASRKFLDRQAAVPGEARQLLEASFSYKLDIPLRVVDDESKKHTGWELILEALPEAVFPPCMIAIKAGLKDGKKRALFAVTNFLTSAGWDYDRIETWMNDWNKNNPEQLREVLIKGHLRYHKQAQKKMLPPNCRKFYEDLTVCHPDGLCQRIKNPVQYARRKAWALNNEAKRGKRRMEDKVLPGKAGGQAATAVQGQTKAGPTKAKRSRKKAAVEKAGPGTPS
jgi:DNA primase catalytic subunit